MRLRRRCIQISILSSLGPLASAEDGFVTYCFSCKMLCFVFAFYEKDYGNPVCDESLSRGSPVFPEFMYMNLCNCVGFPLSVQFSSVQLLSRVRFFVIPWTAARQASLSITNSWSLLKLVSIELVMPSSHLILCRPL